MRKPEKDWYNMNLDEKRVAAGWWLSSLASWDALPNEQKQELAFAATGCLIAYPTWCAPVDCVHTGCQIRRGELPLICLLNRQLQGEIASGWLRFHKESVDGRAKLAALCRYLRTKARATGQYDLWKLDWQAVVYTGVRA